MLHVKSYCVERKSNYNIVKLLRILLYGFTTEGKGCD